MARSNGVFFQVIETPPLNRSGWEVRVIHAKDMPKARSAGINPGVWFSALKPVAIIPRFVELWISPELNDVGAGSITLNLDDPLWSTELNDGSPATDLLEYEHVWQVFEDGLLRFEFLGQHRTTTDVDPSGRRTATISGPGGADALRWMCVLSPYFPGKPPDLEHSDVYNLSIAAMAAYRFLLMMAWARGVITFIRPTFTEAADSAGKRWPDEPKKAETIDNVTAVLNGDLNFFVGSATLTEDAQGKIAEYCVQFDFMAAPVVTLVGHTDSTGSHASNQTLSEQRAQAVANFVLTKVPQAVVKVSGKGETQPIQTNATVWGREQNRRVTMTYPTGPKPEPRKYLTPKFGQNYLDLLNEWTGQNYQQAAPIRAEWFMYPNFTLAVQTTIGTHREKDVVFYEGSSTVLTKGRDRNSASIFNYIALQTNSAGYVIATDDASVDRWNKRVTADLYSQSKFNLTAVANIAQTKLAAQKDEIAEWTVKVEPYGPNRRIFRDYGIGDWIGVSRRTARGYASVDPFRVMGFTLKVSANNRVDLELKLQSAQSSALRKLQLRLFNLENGRDKPEHYIQDEVPTYARVGDLWTPLTPQNYP